MPAVALKTDNTAALIVTERKDLNNRIADNAGKLQVLKSEVNLPDSLQVQ